MILWVYLLMHTGELVGRRMEQPHKELVKIVFIYLGLITCGIKVQIY